MVSSTDGWINPDLKYSRDHEWVKEEDGLFVIGISDFAQDALGDPFDSVDSHFACLSFR